MPDLEWSKVRLDPADRSVLDRAIGALGRRLGEPLHLLRLPHGRALACRVGDLWFCRAGAGGRHPRTWIVAVDTRPEPRTLLPLDDPADFAECCDLLGLRADDGRDRLRTFLTPHPDPTAPGAA